VEDYPRFIPFFESVQKVAARPNRYHCRWRLESGRRTTCDIEVDEMVSFDRVVFHTVGCDFPDHCFKVSFRPLGQERTQVELVMTSNELMDELFDNPDWVLDDVLLRFHNLAERRIPYPLLSEEQHSRS
jgi:hypothetical protein